MGSSSLLLSCYGNLLNQVDDLYMLHFFDANFLSSTILEFVRPKSFMCVTTLAMYRILACRKQGNTAKTSLYKDYK